ncbi:MAG: DUF5667 domain-containing protein [Bacillota bacterium]|nr:DUF5667 domain-containing protein [Bacillota bacterium]
MKKLTSKNELNKIAKGALAMVLAGTFTFSTSQAFADANTSATTTNTAQTNTTTGTSAVGTVLNNTTDVKTTDTVQPSLVPGDFFYFAKIALEKIQLAITFDDTKDAKLLAEFASERLAEAQKLFASGNEEEAVKTMKEAIKDMDSSDKIIEDQKDATKSDDQNEQGEVKEVNPTSDTKTPIDQKKEEDNATNDQVKTENQTNENALPSDAQVKDTEKQAESEKTTNDTADIQNLKDVLSQNILALTAALEKVKNPVAKAALQKNIEKTYAKLSNKIDDLEKKSTEKQKEAEDAKTKATSANAPTEIKFAPVSTSTTKNDNTAVNTGTPATTSTEVNTEKKPADASKPVEEKEQTPPAKHEAKQLVKQIKQQEKENKKHIKKAAKQEEKQARETAKHEIKQMRETEKKEMKHFNQTAKQEITQKRQEVMNLVHHDNENPKHNNGREQHDHEGNQD